MRLSGRIDAYWSEHLKRSIDEELNAGHYTITVDMSEVFYVGSAGIRVLLASFKKLKSLNGAFSVSAPSAEVRGILKMTGMNDLLEQDKRLPKAADAAKQGVEFSTPRFNLAIEAVDVAQKMTCRYVGNPDLFFAGAFSAEHMKTETILRDTLGIGLGAIGGDFSDCRKRFGEFIAVAGTLSYHPTDGTDRLDYSLSAGTFLPEVKMLYGLICQGAFSHVVNFSLSAPYRSAPLSELVEKMMDVLNFKSAALTFVCEAAGLVGAALSLSPVNIPPEGLFAFPQVRENILFTPEKAFPKTLAVIAGVAVTEDNGGRNAFLKPLTPNAPVYGHFHCAVFPYHPLRKNAKALAEVVHRLYESEDPPLSVLHLINDDRDAVGAGESEFTRGLCWISEISDFEFIS